MPTLRTGEADVSEPHGHSTQESAAPPYATILELMNRFQEPEIRSLLAELPLPPGSRGLDVGCGAGLYALWLAEMVGPQGQVVAIDTSPERVVDTEQRVKTSPLADRISVRQGDGTALDEPDQSMDWVWCGDVLHHIDAAINALNAFRRVLRPGGTIIIKESQVLQALFLPGYLHLERQLQRAEIAFQKAEAGEHSFQERRQRTLETMYQAGLRDITMRTVVVQRQAPLDDTARKYIQQAIFDRTWGPRLRPLLDAQDWEQRSVLCEASSPQSILARPDYYCIYPLTLFMARVPG
jgi:demethylmenaquinone methyltransferase/2-methoxy-6-polyprenyl-1,4-benzoquinol methylase